MHTSGKVLAGIVVVGALAAIYLSARTLGIRNAWMTVAQNNEAAIKKNEETLALKRREFDAKRMELARTMIGWDRYWSDIDARIDRQAVLTLALGATGGIAPRQVLFVFAQGPDGTSRYLGDYRVDRVQDTGCTARPNWLLTAGDATPGQFKVRVRTLIPNRHQSRLGALDQQLLATNTAVETNKAELERQKQLTEQTEQLIAARLSEINGAPDLKGKTLPAVNIKGLLSAMVDEEEEYHAALRDGDRLRRDLKRTREAVEATMKANRELGEKLPQSKTAPVGTASR